MEQFKCTMRVIISVLILGTLARTAPSRDNSAQGLPNFATVGTNFRVVINDTVVLPCEVNNLGIHKLVWKRGIAVLTADNVKITQEERIRLVDGYNLEIQNIQIQDAGDYVCQISTLDPKELTHTVEILVPPRIHHVSSGGIMEVKKGNTVTLECKASGNPVPTITWSRKNNLLPSGEKTVEGFSITIEQANRHQAGVYQCMASNGVGQPVTQDINLKVQYAPEIEVERSWVHSGEGYEAQLVCIVHAEPPADVLWFRNTLRLDTTERQYSEVRGSRHTLFIRKVQSSDFGNYSCLADNTLGKSRQYLELSGRANFAIFQSSPQGRSRDSYNISWSVDSYTPVEEFKLYFRKLPEKENDTFLGNHVGIGNSHSERHHMPVISGYGRGVIGTSEWRDVIINVERQDRLSQRVSYLIRGLEPGTDYEAKVQARNRFGWNSVSPGFRFSTRGSASSLYETPPEPAVYAETSARDLGVMSATGGSEAARTRAGWSVAFAFALLLLLAAVGGATSYGCSS